MKNQKTQKDAGNEIVKEIQYEDTPNDNFSMVGFGDGDLHTSIHNVKEIKQKTEYLEPNESHGRVKVKTFIFIQNDGKKIVQKLFFDEVE